MILSTNDSQTAAHRTWFKTWECDKIMTFNRNHRLAANRRRTPIKNGRRKKFFCTSIKIHRRWSFLIFILFQVFFWNLVASSYENYEIIALFYWHGNVSLSAKWIPTTRKWKKKSFGQFNTFALSRTRVVLAVHCFWWLVLCVLLLFFLL